MKGGLYYANFVTFLSILGFHFQITFKSIFFFVFLGSISFSIPYVISLQEAVGRFPQASWKALQNDIHL